MLSYDADGTNVLSWWYKSPYTKGHFYHRRSTLSDIDKKRCGEANRFIIVTFIYNRCLNSANTTWTLLVQNDCRRNTQSYSSYNILILL